jgi:chromosome segregation ATPase
LQALAAENVSLENQLLEAKSSQLRHEKQAAAAAAATAKLEAQLAKLSQRGDESSAELAALTSERRIFKARLMQAEARMRAAGLEPLPPLPSKGV